MRRAERDPRPVFVGDAESSYDAGPNWSWLV